VNWLAWSQGVSAMPQGAVAFGGWLVLLMAAVLGLRSVVEPWLAALIVGVVALALGAGLLFRQGRLDADTLLCAGRSLTSRGRAWIRDQLRDDQERST
jgi:hypothetical protein